MNTHNFGCKVFREDGQRSGRIVNSKMCEKRGGGMDRDVINKLIELIELIIV